LKLPWKVDVDILLSYRSRWNGLADNWFKAVAGSPMPVASNPNNSSDRMARREKLIATAPTSDE
jgi:hypothetical protein